MRHNIDHQSDNQNSNPYRVRRASSFAEENRRKQEAASPELPHQVRTPVNQSLQHPQPRYRQDSTMPHEKNHLDRDASFSEQLPSRANNPANRPVVSNSAAEHSRQKKNQLDDACVNTDGIARLNQPTNTDLAEKPSATPPPPRQLIKSYI